MSGVISVERVKLHCVRLPGREPWYGTRPQLQNLLDQLRKELSQTSDIAALIIHEACDFWDISKRELMSTERTNLASTRRFIVYKILHENGYPMIEIGRLMPYLNCKGQTRDHTNISHGLVRIQKLMESTPSIMAEYNSLKRAIAKKLRQNNNHNEERNGEPTNEQQ